MQQGGVEEPRRKFNNDTAGVNSNMIYGTYSNKACLQRASLFQTVWAFFDVPELSQIGRSYIEPLLLPLCRCSPMNPRRIPFLACIRFSSVSRSFIHSSSLSKDVCGVVPGNKFSWTPAADNTSLIVACERVLCIRDTKEQRRLGYCCSVDLLPHINVSLTLDLGQIHHPAA